MIARRRESIEFGIPCQFILVGETVTVAATTIGHPSRTSVDVVGESKSILVEIPEYFVIVVVVVVIIVIVSIEPRPQLRIGSVRGQHVELHGIITYRIQMVDIVLDFGILRTVLLIDIRLGEDATVEYQAAETRRKHEPMHDGFLRRART